MGDYLKEVAIIGIVIIACVALYSGINGVLLSSAMAGIAGIAGYSLGQASTKSSKKGEGWRAREKGGGLVLYCRNYPIFAANKGNGPN